jgi:hypothetical protein
LTSQPTHRLPVANCWGSRPSISAAIDLRSSATARNTRSRSSGLRRTIAEYPEPWTTEALVEVKTRCASYARACCPARQWHQAPTATNCVEAALDQRPWRRLFVKVTGGRRSVHLHVMTPDSPRWQQQIAFPRRPARRSRPDRAVRRPAWVRP